MNLMHEDVLTLEKDNTTTTVQTQNFFCIIMGLDVKKSRDKCLFLDFIHKKTLKLKFVIKVK